MEQEFSKEQILGVELSAKFLEYLKYAQWLESEDMTELFLNERQEIVDIYISNSFSDEEIEKHIEELERIKINRCNHTAAESHKEAIAKASDELIEHIRNVLSAKKTGREESLQNTENPEEIDIEKVKIEYLQLLNSYFDKTIALLISEAEAKQSKNSIVTTLEPLKEHFDAETKIHNFLKDTPIPLDEMNEFQKPISKLFFEKTYKYKLSGIIQEKFEEKTSAFRKMLYMSQECKSHPSDQNTQQKIRDIIAKIENGFNDISGIDAIIHRGFGELDMSLIDTK